MRQTKTPSLRLKMIRGGKSSVVTLPDAISKKRRDYYCGPWESEQAQRQYASLIVKWELAGRCWPIEAKPGIPLRDVYAYYSHWTKTYYAKAEGETIRAAWRVVLAHCGEDMPAEQFGPLKMREVRHVMIGKGWNRQFINRQMHRVAAVFKWAASNELIPVTIYQALKTIEPLRRGRCIAPESERVRPVCLDIVSAIRDEVPRQVWAIIELQRLTGARPCELLGLTPGAICRDTPVWQVDLEEHKTAHHGKRRSLLFGPQAQAVIRPFLFRPDDKPLFSPAEAEDERIRDATENRKTPLNAGNSAEGRRRKDLGDSYTTNTYRRCIDRACTKVFPLPADLVRLSVKGKSGSRYETMSAWRARLGDRWAEVESWRKAHSWHPYQLRHTAATEIRKKFGLEAAAVVLGHSSATITDAIYAERDVQKAAEIMGKIG